MKEGTPKAEIFFYCLLAFIGGVVLGGFLFLDLFFLFCLWLVSIFFLIYSCFGRKHFLSFLIIACFLFGWMRFEISLPDCSREDLLCRYNGQEIVFSGAVIRVDSSGDRQQLRLRAENYGSKKIKGGAYLSSATYPLIRQGDLLKVSCLLQGLENIKQEGFAKYLSRQGIYSVCQHPEIEIIGRQELSSNGLIGGLRFYLAGRMNRTLPEPSASLMRGMILGDGAGLPKEFKDMFSQLGLSHVIAISGSHIAIVCSVLLSIFIAFGFSRQKSFVPIVAITIFYVVLVGSPASAVRSAIMGLMVLFAQRIGRLSRSRNLLATAAAVMALSNPQVIMGDVGFQLSFIAVWGLIYISPLIKDYFKIFPKAFQINEIMIATFAAQLSTLPLILFQFGKFSFISFIANLLILPIIPALTILGLIQAIVSSMSIVGGKLVGFPVWLLCSYWIETAQWLSRLPMSGWGLGQINPVIALSAYFLMFFWIWRSHQKNDII